MRLLYPNLNLGLVGAWCPSVDRSRSTILTDQSGYNNHGTLTLMDPATDCDVSNGKIVLDFDGINDRVVAANAPALNDATMVAWVRWRGSATSNARIVDATYDTGFWMGQNSLNTTSLRGGFRASGAPYGATATLPNNTGLHCFAVTRQGTTNQAYMNGKIGDAPYTGGSGATTPAGMCFGSTLIPDQWSNMQLAEFRLYNRVLTGSELLLLAMRPGIAYETKRVTRSRIAGGGGGGGGGFKAAWSIGSNVVLGA